MEMKLLVSQLAAPAPTVAPSAGSAAGGTFRGVSPVAAAPEEAQVMRFRRAMGEVLPGDDLAGPDDLRRGPGGQAAVTPAQPAGAQRHVGDAILSGLDALSGDLQRVWNALRVSGPGKASPLPGPAESTDWIEPVEKKLDATSIPGGENKTAAADGLHAAEGNGMPRIGDLVQMQRHMTEFAFYYEAVGKGTSKMIDNTNQLVKMQ